MITVMKRGFQIGPVLYTWRALVRSTLLVAGAVALFSLGGVIYVVSGATKPRPAPPNQEAVGAAFIARNPRFHIRYDQPQAPAPVPAFGDTNRLVRRLKLQN